MHGRDAKYKVLVGIPRRKTPLGSPRHRWDGGSEDVSRINLAVDVNQIGLL
jgi:hypothetical protein